MRKLLYISFIIAAVFSQHGFAQSIRKLKNEAFKPGEKLKFKMRYGFIEAGMASLEIKPEMQTVVGRNAYHIEGKGESVGTFDFFFKVRDSFDSYVDEEAIIPWKFIRKVNEGGFKFTEELFFNHYKNQVVCNNGDNSGTYNVVDNVQDLISMYYYSRLTDVTNFKPGDCIPIQTFIDKEVVTLNLKFIKREVIKTKFGKYKALVFRPQLQKGRVFKEQEGMTMWISDDKNHIPLKGEAKLLVGSIKMELIEASGLANTPAVE